MRHLANFEGSSGEGETSPAKKRKYSVQADFDILYRKFVNILNLGRLMSENENDNIGRIENVDIEEELKDSYLAYAMSVIVGRALPDVRDGLKPVHRRILYAMSGMRLVHTGPTKKCAGVVGEVMGKYHPHGDQAIYDALVRLAQNFNMRLPLVVPQGNFGSIDGDPPAAMRYTECKMDRVCTEVMADIEKETVDFSPNYDNSEFEPSVLPTKVPLLLVNGSSGIAVGMSTNIPPHNLGEVIDGVVYLMQNPEIMSLDQREAAKRLMQYIQGPDFPTSATIHGRRGIFEAYRTGTGSVQVRGKAEEEIVNGNEAIVITELPYQVNKVRLLEKIAELVRDKRIEGISALRDVSDMHGIRIIVETKKAFPPAVVINQLYKMTSLQVSIRINMLCIVNNRPLVLPLREVLHYFIEFRRDVTVRRTIYLLRKAKERAHILEGLKIALDNIDAVIALIRSSATTQEAKAGLIAQFALSDLQAQAILEMRLQRLTGLERDKIINELEQLLAQIADYEDILASAQRIDDIIIEELLAVKASFADPRRTDIIEEEADIDFEDLITEESVIVTRTRQDYIKRVPLTEYRAQRRGGRGKLGMNTKEDDYVLDLFVANTHQRILVFTSAGRVYLFKVYDIPAGSRITRGKPIIHMIPKLEPGEEVATVLPIQEFEERYLVMVTKNGIIKRTPLSAFARVHAGGIRAMNIREGDELIAASSVVESDELILVSRDGLSIRFKVSDLRPMARTAMGVRAMRLRDEDRVIAMEIVHDPEGLLLTVTANGYGKRTYISEHRLQSRGGKGIFVIKPSQRNGKVIGALQVSEEDHILMVTDEGTIIRTRVSEISIVGRATQGVRLMKPMQDEHVVAVARIVEPEEDDEGLQPIPIDDEEVEDDDELLEEELDEDNDDELDDDLDEGHDDEFSDEDDEG